MREKLLEGLCSYTLLIRISIQRSNYEKCWLVLWRCSKHTIIVENHYALNFCKRKRCRVFYPPKVFTNWCETLVYN